MKTLLTLLCLFLSIGLFAQSNSEEFVKSHLSIRPDSSSFGKYKDFTIYNVYFKDCKFVIVHRFKVTFQQAEGWEYYCILEEGKQIDISGVSDDTKRKLLNVWLKNRR